MIKLERNPLATPEPLAQPPLLGPDIFHRLLSRALRLPLLLALAAIAVLTWQILHLLADLRWLNHTQQVLAQANYAYRLVVDAESAQRGYQITERENFLEPFRSSGPLAEPSLQRLRSLVDDNPSQSRRVARLIERYRHWASLPPLKQVPRKAQGDLLLNMTARKGAMDGLRIEFDDFIREEQALRDIRTKTSDRSAGRLILFTAGTLLLMALLLSWLARRSLSKLSGSYQTRVDAGKEALLHQQHLTAALKRSNAELDQYAHIASHDLKEPLRMITSYMGLLKMRYGDKLDAEAIRYVDFATEGATRLHQLLSDLLHYSQLESKPPKLADTDMNTVYEIAAQHLREAVRDSGAEISSAKLPTIPGDALQLTLLFQNLLANGIKFRRPGVIPRVKVSARELAEDWEFRVQDNGIGIDPEYFHRLFIIFNRLHAREEYPGSGIGLATCKRVIERHRGRIWVESQPGEGTAFLFTLPKRASFSAATGSS